MLWVLTLTAGVLVGVRLGVLALLSAAWGVVFLCRKRSALAAVAFAAGILIIGFLVALTGRFF